jgi:NarL family two-component system response regulator LiaR
MNIKVSIVEDNNSFRASLAQLIRCTHGMVLVSEYSNAEKALRITNDNPDIAIIDIELPGMNGIELIKKLKPLNKKTEYLICSSYDDDEKIFSALEAGACGYILKDSTSQEIIRAIKELYNHGSPMSAAIARRVITFFQKKPLPAGILSDREMEVLQLMAKGLQHRQVGELLTISAETVKKHSKNIYQKLDVQNKIEALNKFNLLYKKK